MQKKTIRVLQIIYILFILILPVIPNEVQAWTTPTRYEYQTNYSGDYGQIFSTQWEAQTFTIGSNGDNSSFYITGVNVYLDNVVGTPDGAYLSIQGLTSGYPSGNILTVNTFSANSVSGWTNISLNQCKLLPGQQYAIVLKGSGSSASNSYGWKGDGDAYSGGNEWYTTNSGSSWTSNTSMDLAFEIYGYNTSTDEITGFTVTTCSNFTAENLSWNRGTATDTWIANATNAPYYTDWTTVPSLAWAYKGTALSYNHWNLIQNMRYNYTAWAVENVANINQPYYAFRTGYTQIRPEGGETIDEYFTVPENETWYVTQIYVLLASGRVGYQFADVHLQTAGGDEIVELIHHWSSVQYPNFAWVGSSGVPRTLNPGNYRLHLIGGVTTHQTHSEFYWGTEVNHHCTKFEGTRQIFFQYNQSYNYTMDVTPPSISNVSANPQYQSLGGGVNITAKVKDDFQVNNVNITIFGDTSSIEISNEGGSSTGFVNPITYQTFTIPAGNDVYITQVGFRCYNWNGGSGTSYYRIRDSGSNILWQTSFDANTVGGSPLHWFYKTVDAGLWLTAGQQYRFECDNPSDVIRIAYGNSYSGGESNFGATNDCDFRISGYTSDFTLIEIPMIKDGDSIYYYKANYTKMGGYNYYIKADDTAVQGANPSQSINYIFRIQGWIDIYDEYPSDNTKNASIYTVVGAYVNHLNGDLQNLDIYYYSNVTGDWTLIGANLSVPGGERWYEMSSYGVVASPYGVPIVYQLDDFSSKIYHSNPCPGNDLGEITSVEIASIGDWNGTIQPIFDGMQYGDEYFVAPWQSAIIYNDTYSPTEWTWDDIKNLDVWADSLTDPNLVISVTYNMQYGENQKIYWAFNVTDGSIWENRTFSFTTLSKTPVISNENPQDARIYGYLRPTLHAYISDPDGDSMQIKFFVINNTDWIQLGTTQTGTNGTYSQPYLDADGYSSDYLWKIQVTDGTNTVERMYRFTIRDIHEPPVNLTAIPINSASIGLTWEIPQYVDYIIIKKRSDRFPEFDDPGFIYEGSSNYSVDLAVTPSTPYYYRAWSYNASDNVWSNNNSTTYAFSNPAPPSSFNANTFAYNQINLSWVKGTGANTTLLYRKTGGYPENRTDAGAVLLYEGTGASYADTYKMGGNITYYYRAWSFADGYLIDENNVTFYVIQYSSDTADKNATTFVGPPTLDPTVSNIDNTSVTLHTLLISDGGETSTCGLYYGDLFNHFNITKGSYNTNDIYDYIPALNIAHTYYFQPWGYNSYGFIVGKNVTFATKPYEPTVLSAIAINSSEVFLSWFKGDGADTTYIRYKSGSYPTNISDGTLTYNGIDISTTATSLGGNTTYYFRAWSYNSTSQIYSNYYAQDYDTTPVGIPVVNITYPPINIENITATLRGILVYDNGDACTVGFRYGLSSGVYTEYVTSTGKYTTGQSFTKDIIGLSPGTTYYYQAWAANSLYFNNSAEQHFCTKPVAPIGFYTEAYGASRMNLSWIKPSGADKTKIVRKLGSYPTSISDGEIRYFGYDNYYHDWEWYPLLENTKYYYSAWSYNDTGTSGIGFYSNDYLTSSDTTSLLPTMDNEIPLNNAVNVNRYVNFLIKVHGNNLLNVTFYNAHDLDRAKEKLGDSGSSSGIATLRAPGWLDPINRTGATYYYVTYGLISYNSGFNNMYPDWYVYYDRFGEHWKYHYRRISQSVSTGLSGGINAQTWKPTISLNSPMLISGIYVGQDSGSFHLNSNPKGYAGYSMTTWFDYHDYDTNQWITASYNVSTWGSTALYTDKPVRVDSIRTYRKATAINQSCSSSFYVWNMYVNYITCIPPTYLYTQNVTDGGTAGFTSTYKTLDRYYYWGITVNDTLDVGYSPVYNFKTENITIENEIPIDGAILTDKSPDHDCSAIVNHSGGDAMNISFYHKADNGSWVLDAFYTSVYNGTYSFTYYNSDQYTKTYYWKVHADDGLDTYEEIHYFGIRMAYYPYNPQFNLNVINLTAININTIYSNDYCNAIAIAYSNTSYPNTPLEGTLLFNTSGNTSADYILNNLNPETTYYFTGFAWNATDNVYSVTKKSTQTYRPGPPVFSTQMINTTGVKLMNISSNIYTDSIIIRYKDNAYPTDMNDGTFVANLTFSGTELTYNHYGLIFNSTYYYRAWSWNASTNHWGTAYYSKTGSTNGPPYAYDEYPKDGASKVDVNTSINITVWDLNNGPMDIYFRTNETGSWTTFANWSNAGNGRYTTLNHPFHLQDVLHYWTVNVTDGVFWYNASYYYTAGSLPVVQNITSIENETEIDLHWEQLYGSDRTLIRGSDTAYPLNTTDGALIYYGTSNIANDTGLLPGELYYYTFWGHNDTSGENSTDNVTYLALTKPYPPTNIAATPATYRTVNLSWVMGDGATRTIIIFKLDSYPQNTSDGTEIFNSSGIYYLHTGLKPRDFYISKTPEPGINNIGVYPLGGQPFNQSCDNDLSTKWDPNAEQDGTFSYILANNERVVSLDLLFQDFYNDPGATWNANFTKIEIKNNGSWTTDWTGLKHNSGSIPEWWYYDFTQTYDNTSEVRITGHTAFIQPNVYEIYIGKLGYRYRYKIYSYVSKGGLSQISDDGLLAEGTTQDTPFNSPPYFTNFTPTPNATKVEPDADISLNVYDDQGQPMSVTLQTNFSGLWQNITTQNNKLNETIYFTLPRWGFEKNIYWRIVADDHADVGDSYYYQGTNLNSTETFYFQTRRQYVEPDFSFSSTNVTNEDTVTLIDKTKNATSYWWKINGKTYATATYSNINHEPFNVSLKFMSNIYTVTLEVENATDAGYKFNASHTINVDRNITYYKTPQSGINYVSYHLSETITAQQFIQKFNIPNGSWVHKYNSTSKQWESVWCGYTYNNFAINPWNVLVVVVSAQFKTRINITSQINTNQVKTISQGITYLAWTGDQTTLMNLSFGLQTGDWIHVYDTLTNAWNSRWLGYALIGTDVTIKPYDVIVVSTAGTRTINIGGIL